MTNPKLALVLDDIDKAKPTDFARDILFELIDERINNRASLLITTNMNSGEFAEAYGEAIASRVAGYCEAKRIDGDDRRQSR
jgi:DNA replication protein DnaC